MSNGEWQIEMTWRCTSCRHQNLGRHTTCVQCGDPKDASEQYEMPAAAAAPPVTDPALLRIATSGANWRCGYCGSDQRRVDGVCARCGGAPVPTASLVGVDPARAARSNRTSATRQTRSTWSTGLFALAVAIPILACLGAISLVAGNRPTPVQPAPEPPRNVDAIVESVEWQHSVRVDRFRNWRREGFVEQRPSAATEIRPLGERVHHTDRVPDGFDAEHYSERVQEGFDTETYSERVECGQDCTSLPDNCAQECSPNGNGFATCRNVCTPGGQRCTTRYCDQARTRQVPRFVNVDRTRQVPRFRDEPRLATWFEWHVWDWGEDRVVRAEGGDIELRWPDAQPTSPLADGERERERRDAHYRVTLRYDGTQSFTFAPVSDSEFARFAPGSRHALRIAQFHTPELNDPLVDAVAGGG